MLFNQQSREKWVLKNEANEAEAERRSRLRGGRGPEEGRACRARTAHAGPPPPAVWAGNSPEQHPPLLLAPCAAAWPSWNADLAGNGISNRSEHKDIKVPNRLDRNVSVLRAQQRSYGGEVLSKERTGEP